MRKLRIAFVGTIMLVGAVLIALLIPGVTTGIMNRVYRTRHNGHSADYWVHELKNTDPHVRQEAVFALGVIGAEAEDAVPEVCVLLKDPEPRVRCDAALALLKMYPASHGTASSLAEVLEDDMPLARMNAAITLNRLGLEARPAVPALLKALGDKQNDLWIPGFQITIREALLQALGRATAGTHDGVEALTEALKDERAPCRAAAARALGEVGSEAQTAVPLLQAALKDNNERVKAEAASALKKIGPEQE